MGNRPEGINQSVNQAFILGQGVFRPKGMWTECSGFLFLWRESPRILLLHSNGQTERKRGTKFAPVMSLSWKEPECLGILAKSNWLRIMLACGIIIHKLPVHNWHQFQHINSKILQLPPQSKFHWVNVTYSKFYSMYLLGNKPSICVCLCVYVYL